MVQKAGYRLVVTTNGTRLNESIRELPIDELYVSVASVDKGPNKHVRRWRPRAMGRATKVTKGVSHIVITNSDHTRAAEALRAEFGAKVYGPRAEAGAFPMDVLVADGDVLPDLDDILGIDAVDPESDDADTEKE